MMLFVKDNLCVSSRSRAPDMAKRKGELWIAGNIGIHSTISYTSVTFSSEILDRFLSPCTHLNLGYIQFHANILRRERPIDDRPVETFDFRYSYQGNWGNCLVRFTHYRNHSPLVLIAVSAVFIHRDGWLHNKDTDFPPWANRTSVHIFPWRLDVL